MRWRRLARGARLRPRILKDLATIVMPGTLLLAPAAHGVKGRPACRCANSAFQAGGILPRDNEAAMTSKTITLPAELYERVEQEAQAEGNTVDVVVTEAVKRELARRWLDRTRREAELRRGNMTDDEVEAAVETAVKE